MPKRFCAICGNDIDENAPHFAMCLNCYLKEYPLFVLPDRYEMKICNSCGKFAKKEIWIQTRFYDILDVIKDALRTNLLRQIKGSKNIQFKITPIEESIRFSSSDLIDSLEVEVFGVLEENSSITWQQLISINITYELCKNCSKLKAGTYFTSILQLRKTDEKSQFLKDLVEDISEYVQELFKKDQKQYITNIIDQRNGYDLYLSTNELLNHILSYLKGKYHFGLKRTKKLVGRDNQRGKNLYRLKAVIRFLPFSKDDHIFIENMKYYVENVKKKTVILRDSNKNKITKNYDFFFNDKITLKKV